MTETRTKPNRRAVLLAGLGAPAAAAVAAAGGEPAAAREVDDAGSPLMRETEHTRAYFASTRI